MVNYEDLKVGDWYHTLKIVLDGPYRVADKIERVVVLDAAPIAEENFPWSMVAGFLTSNGGLAVWKSFPQDNLISKTGEHSSTETLIKMLMQFNGRLSRDWAEILAETGK